MTKPDNPEITTLNCPNCGASVALNEPSCSYCNSTLISRVCANCLRTIGFNINHCPNCGVAVMKTQSVPKKDIKCPICMKELEIHESYNHPIYACHQCGGMWMDHESFHLLCDRAEKQALDNGYKLPEIKVAPATGKSRRPYIPCPECGVIMNPRHFAKSSGIVIDTCRNHGNWFDFQELCLLVEFIQKGGMSKSRRLDERPNNALRRHHVHRFLNPDAIDVF